MKKKHLAGILTAGFIFAVIMGAGPGVFLVNPDPDDPDARRFLFGVPIVYLWAVGWFFVQASCVVIAYRVLWRAEEDSEREGEEGTS